VEIEWLPTSSQTLLGTGNHYQSLKIISILSKGSLSKNLGREIKNLVIKSMLKKTMKAFIGRDCSIIKGDWSIFQNKKWLKCKPFILMKL
jgi:hypothetical protein